MSFESKLNEWYMQKGRNVIPMYSELVDICKTADDLCKAKDDLIEFYENYISDLNGYLSAHRMNPSSEQVKIGEGLRGAIKEIEDAINS